MVQIAVGEVPDLSPSRDNGAAVCFLAPETDGLVTSVSGVELAAAMEGVVRVVVTTEKGDLVPPLLNATGRVGYVICQADDATAAREQCRRAAQLIAVET